MRNVMKLGLLALLGVAFVFGARLLGLDELLTLDGMRSWVDSWGNLGPVAFIGICTLGIVLYLPESLLLTFGGDLCGTRQMPVPSRIRSVTAAAVAIAANGSSIPACTPRPRDPSAE